MRILFKLTSRSRPQRFFETLDNIISHVSPDCNYRIHCTLDTGDWTMNQQGIIDCMEKYSNVMWCFGKSKNKIDAINRDMDMVGEWDVLVNMSDDMRFTVKGFDKIILNEFANGTDICLHAPDTKQKDKLITLAILGKDYYNRFGYIYHPAYISLWVDVEMTDVAKLNGRYRYLPQFLFEHQHPSFGMGVMDEQYRHTESFEPIDKQTYLTRKANGFT